MRRVQSYVREDCNLVLMDLSLFLLLVVLRICRDGTASSIFLPTWLACLGLLAKCCYLMRQRCDVVWHTIDIEEKRKRLGPSTDPCVELRTLHLWC